MLSVQDLHRPGLSSTSFDLAAGECLAVQGVSGSGKTLLLRAIADLDPNTGSITLDDISRDAVPAPLWRRQVAYVPAEPGWWADTVAPHFPIWDKAEPIAAMLGLPASCGEANLSTLSTGERLRLALVRALVLDPRVLLLDEPTAALDPLSTQAIETVITARINAGVGVLWVTHDPAQVGRVANGLIRVEHGSVGNVER